MTEEPLTTAALQKFYEVMDTGLRESSLPGSTKNQVDRNLFIRTMPVPVTDDGRALPIMDTDHSGSLPGSIRELRETMEDKGSVPSSPFFQKPDQIDIYAKILEKALRAASREMQKDAARSGGSAMLRITEKPLTTPALQKFYEVLGTGLNESSLTHNAKISVRMSLLCRTLPVPLFEDGTPVPFVSTKHGRPLPASLRDLREKAEDIIGSSSPFYYEPYQIDIYARILDKALRAASREMQKGAAHSRD